MTRRESCHLLDMLAKLRDPRKHKGKRHPLKSILALLVIGLMCGHKGYTSIATWARSQLAIAKALATADTMQIKAELEANGSLQIEAAGETYTLEQSEIDVQTQNREGFFVEVDAKKFVALSTELTHELVLEGMARELVNKIQNMRKDADFNVSDRIKLSLNTASALVKEAFKTHRDYILAETLTTEIVEFPSENAFSLEQKLNGEPATLSVEQV